MSLRSCIAVFVLLAMLGPGARPAAAQDARYRTRASGCRYDVPAGRSLQLDATAAPAEVHGATAGSVRSFLSDAATLSGGEIVACTEYGRVEIEDSDDNRVHIQVRIDASGEGSVDAPAAARKMIDESRVRVYATENAGRLNVSVWSDTLAFSPHAQPALVGIRIQVPNRGRYALTAEAYHGPVSVRRLTLRHAAIRGRVGDKFKGIPGYIGYIELDNVGVAGEVVVTSDGEALSAPVLAKVRPISSGSLSVTNGSDINLFVQPDPALGLRVFAASNAVDPMVLVENSASVDTVASPWRAAVLRQTIGFDSRDVRLQVRATSTRGKVSVASMPAAPRPPNGIPSAK
jgi:hypothetical protein